MDDERERQLENNKIPYKPETALGITRSWLATFETILNHDIDSRSPRNVSVRVTWVNSCHVINQQFVVLRIPGYASRES